MTQTESSERVFADPRVAARTYAVVRTARAMGLVEPDDVVLLNAAGLRRVLRTVQGAGIARDAELQAGAIVEQVAAAKRRILDLLAHVNAALEASPTPASEWGSLRRVFGDDDLADLLGISQVSLRRYSSSQRDTPDLVAARLHFLALLTADLAGAYNDIGVRRWFRRKRTQLDNRAPADMLRADWQPEGEGPQRVRQLARSLTGSPAT